MANEISVRQTITVRNGSLIFSYDSGTLQFDQAAAGGPTPGYVTIGTTEESVAFSELGTVGYVALKNLSTANYVRWGFSTGVYGGRLEPNEVAQFRLNPGTTLYLIANTAVCKCLVYGLED
jgi:hypothetical protein